MSVKGKFIGWISDVRNCPRCGGDHDELTFKPFSRSERHTHWAMCPVANDPILQTLVECREDELDEVAKEFYETPPPEGNE